MGLGGELGIEQGPLDIGQRDSRMERGQSVRRTSGGKVLSQLRPGCFCPQGANSGLRVGLWEVQDTRYEIVIPEAWVEDQCEERCKDNGPT